jgi:hypothetical protein
MASVSSSPSYSSQAAVLLLLHQPPHQHGHGGACLRYRGSQSQGRGNAVATSLGLSAAGRGGAGGLLLLPPLPALRAAEGKDGRAVTKDEEEEAAADAGRSRSLHGLISNGGSGSGLRFTIPKASRSKPVAQREQPTAIKVEKSEEDAEAEAMAEVASALRAVGDKFLRMEERRLEISLQIEKERMESEMKRTQTLLDAQQLFVEAFLGKQQHHHHHHKKAKVISAAAAAATAAMDED